MSKESIEPGKDERIERVILQLRVLKEQGLLVDLDIRGLGMFQMSVALIEFGVSEGDARGERVRGGRRLLLPERIDNRIRSCANGLRRALDRHSFPIVQFGGWKWVPNTAWKPFQAEFERRRGEMEAIKEEIIAGLPEHKREALDLADKIAGQIWRMPRLRREFGSREALVSLIRGRVEKHFPDEARVREGLRVEMRTGVLLTSADTAAELAAEAEARRRIEDEARLSRLKDEKAWAAVERMRARTEAMRQAALEYAREQVAREMAPFDFIFNELRARVYDEARAVLDVVQRNGALNPKTRERVGALVEMFNHLNVGDDRELEALLERARQAAQDCPVQVRARPAGDAPDAAVDALADALRGVVDACSEARRQMEREMRTDAVQIL